MYSTPENIDPKQAKALLPLLWLFERSGSQADGMMPIYISAVRGSFALAKRDVLNFQIDDYEEANKRVDQMFTEKWTPLEGSDIKVFRTQFIHRNIIVGYNDNVIEFFMAYGGDNSGMTITFVGDPAWVDYNMAFFRENMEDTAIRMMVPHVEDDAIQITRQRVPLDTLEAELPQVHYPYLDLTPSDLITQFMESDENVLVIIGPPGTGKSTYLRAMLHGHYRYQKQDDSDDFTTRAPYLISDQAVLQLCLCSKMLMV